jgi:histidyl-tRNA synthetase
LIAICAEFFREVGLKSDQVVVYVNDRRLMESILNDAGLAGNLKEAFHLLDRREKMNSEAWEAYAGELGLSGGQLDKLKIRLADPDLWRESEWLVRVFNALDVLGAGEYVQFNAGIVRGLDYYTATVWEAKERTQSGRSILGGGRYDNLVGDVGGEPLSASGFAMGDVMLSVILRDYGLLPQGVPDSADALVTVFNADSRTYSLKLAADLRKCAIKTAIYPEEAKLQKQLKYADKIGVKLVLISGPDEVAANKVTIKDLKSGEQMQVRTAEAGDKITELLARSQGS